MINADMEKGIIKITGYNDILLTEYTMITRVVLHQLKEDLNEEAAFKILANLGQIAAKDIDQLGGDVENIYKAIEEVYKNEVQV